MKNILILMRPHQWVKNLFLFAPLFFTFVFKETYILHVTIGFFIFSLTASAIYILNDYRDVEEDRVHPTKRKRPLASGMVSTSLAIFIMICLLASAFVGAIYLSFSFFLIIVIYVIMNLAYTFKLKHISILDITTISVGFVLRIYAGAALIDNTPSTWIVLVTFVLALFLALAKRRDDCLLALDGKKTRKSIDGYNLEMVNAAMTLMAGVTIVAYIMYTVSPEVTARLETHYLYLTAFFVILGVMRYMQLTFVEQNSGSPTKLVLKDRFLQVVIVSWIVSFYIIIKGF